MTIEIRRLAPPDIPELQDLLGACADTFRAFTGRSPREDEARTRLLPAPESDGAPCLYGIHAGPLLAGLAEVLPDHPRGLEWVLTLIRPGFRRKGLGRRLMAHVLQDQGHPHHHPQVRAVLPGVLTAHQGLHGAMGFRRTAWSRAAADGLPAAQEWLLRPGLRPTPEPPTALAVRHKHARYLLPALATYYQEPLVPLSGRGSRITDLEGRTYLDFFGGILTTALGHAHPRVDRAVLHQVHRLTHTSTFYPAPPMVALAERLVTAAPGRLDKVFFSATGTEADEMAVALAQVHTGNQEIIALRHGYAGRSLLGQALDGLSTHRPLPAQVAAVRHAPTPYCYRCPLHLEPRTCHMACAQDLEDLIATTTTGRIAGMLVEPILGAGGCIPPPPDYLPIAAGIVRRHGGVMIADEVQTGLGRTGRLWATQHSGLEPEIMTLGKAIANGLPLAATLCTPEIALSFKASTISTFGGNPVSCAAASAVLEEIREADLVANAAQRGLQLREGLDRLQARFPALIGDVRGLGLMQGLELVRDETIQDRTPDPAAVESLLEATRRRGLLLGRGGLHGNVIRLAPPLNVTAGEIQESLGILAQAFAATQEARP